MSKRRDIRRLAMQLLYQIDLGGEADRDAILAALAEDAHDAAEVRLAAADLALAAWEQRERADELVRELAPDWPTHRQPPVDRALLRLAIYEITTGHAPAKVAINEAVELAKEYAGEHSFAFVNGVLDKIARKLEAAGALPAASEPEAKTDDADAWLRDVT